MLRMALVVGATALAAVAGAAPHTGKDVRVEREAGKPQGTPRLCQVAPNDLTAFCGGKKPELGDIVTVLDTHHVVATLRVDQVTANVGCPQAQTWNVQLKAESGVVPSSGGELDTTGVIDVAVDPQRAHLIRLDHAPGGRQVTSDNMLGVDANGDGIADLVFVGTKCDDAGQPSANPTGQCLEIWYPSGRQYAWLRTDRYASCF
jgi:hypothetical protein